MIIKIRDIFKRTLVLIMCVISMGLSILTSSSAVIAGDAYNQLGTNAALGSPLLNKNFTAANWNKWEMICWGVFLSNFCVPLVDDYKSAFTVDNGGSNGSGYDALCFGSGNDSNNNKIVQELCNYAILQQTASCRDIWVTYNWIDNGLSEEYRIDPNSADNQDKVRLATFKDLWVYSEFTNKTYSYDTDFKNKAIGELTPKLRYSEYDSSYDGEHDLLKPIGILPTFWIKDKNKKYVKIFDYTDPWDIQITSAMISKALTDASVKKLFVAGFKSYYESNTSLKFDCFGNIVTSNNKIIIPASANKNITDDSKINTLNSFLLNGNTYSTKAANVLLSASQYIREDEVGMDVDNSFGAYGPLGCAPALAHHESSLDIYSTYLYYDLDTIEVNKGSTMTYGEKLIELFDTADIKANVQKYNLKIETVNRLETKMFNDDPNAGGGGEYSAKFGKHMLAASIISTVENKETKPEILTEITMPDGDKLDIFSTDPILIPVAIKSDGNEDENASGVRRLWNFMYQCYKGKVNSVQSIYINPVTLKNELEKITRVEGGDNSLADFIEDAKLESAYKSYSGRKDDIIIQRGEDGIVVDYADNETFSDDASRVIVLYPTSEVMYKVSEVLGVKEGVEFSIYSPYIYATYLEFYGIAMNTKLDGTTTPVSEFSTEIYDESTDLLNVDPSDLLDLKSPEQLEEELKYYSYMMLSPTAGRSYRNELISTGMSDWIYEQYSKIVFGTKTSNTSISSKSNSGFLAISTYADNFATKPFIENYANIAVWIIMGSVILTVLVGLIKGRKIVWYLMQLIIIINIVLITPSMGELVPYFSSKIVQNMFMNKMTYWGISEAVTNATIESDMADQSGGLAGLSADEAEQVVYLLKSLDSLYLDRSLMLKRDISAKTVQNVKGVYNDIQSLQSARWLLPMIMRQYSQEDGGADYVYMKTGDLYDDMSNMYWLYVPENAAEINSVQSTMTSNQSGDEVASVSDADLDYRYDNMSSMYIDYKDVSEIPEDINVNYKSYAYTIKANDKPLLIHTHSFMLKDTHCPSRQLAFNNTGGYKDSSSFENYINYYVDTDVALKTSLKTISTNIMDKADIYDRTDRATVDELYGYLWATESPAHYFYQLTKESIRSTSTLASVIGNLQGDYAETKNGKEVRTYFKIERDPDTGESIKKHQSLLFAEEIAEDGKEYPTGYTRDIMDLEYMFTNFIPYMYQMQMISGGTDGNGGVLIDIDDYGNEIPSKITDEFKVYEGQNQSWLFRCNWVVKLIECPEYDREMEISDAEGNKYKVKHPMLYECYPEERPMIFSEAQMYAYGLHESDLNLVELKCIKANKELAKRWTLLINYAGTPGITLEVLERQMALEALFIFDSTFSPSGVFNSSYQLYPQNLDLRNISFDSVMKMLMMNVSRDTSYIYGNTMLTLIENTDMFTAMLLLIIASLCAYIIPLVRDLLMAMIFYLGIFAMIRSITADVKFKTKVTCGQFTCNLLFLLFTSAYYLIFNLLISMTSTDEVLTIDTIAVNSGNPMWVLVIVLVASIAYIALLLWEIDFCFKHYRDMGGEIYQSFVIGTINKLSKSLSSSLKGIKNSMDNDRTETNEKIKANKSSSSKNSGGSNSIGNNSSGTEHNVGDGSADNQITDDLYYDTNTGKYKSKKSDKDDYDNRAFGDSKTEESREDKDASIIDKAIKDGENKSSDKKEDRGDRKNTIETE